MRPDRIERFLLSVIAFGIWLMIHPENGPVQALGVGMMVYGALGVIANIVGIIKLYRSKHEQSAK